MKEQILSIVLLASCITINAQTWGGSTSQTGNTYRTGNVGIGNTNPGEILDVTGNIKASGSMFWGSNFVRTETKNDPNLSGPSSRSGFFETSSASSSSNWPSGSSGWWHLLDVRHSNTGNNYAMQFAGSFFNQELYFRKTNNFSAQPWAKVLTSLNGWMLSGNSQTNSNNDFIGTTDNQHLVFRTNNTERMRITNTGIVGIGTNNPFAQLHVVTPGNSTSGLMIEHNYTSPYSFAQLIKVKHDQTKALCITRVNGANENVVFQVWGNGKTQIGNKTSTSHTDAFLSVDGKIVCKDLYVTASNDWPDYVFEKNYKLPSLDFVKNYYTQNKHLPGVPTANEIKEKGINISEISTIQMQKIEELTLYIIQLKEEIEVLKKEIHKN